MKCFKKDSVYRELLFILITSVLSSFFTYIFMKKQMNFDVEKELFFRQMHVYNKVVDLYRNFELYKTTIIAPTQKRFIVIVRDQFGNEVKKEEILGEVKQKDTLDISIPNFVVQDSAYDTFLENIQYLKANKDNLSPNIYERTCAVLDFLEKHPVPEKKDRYSFLLYWSDEDVYRKFYVLLRDLYYACNEEQKTFYSCWEK